VAKASPVVPPAFIPADLRQPSRHGALNPRGAWFIVRKNKLFVCCNAASFSLPFTSDPILFWKSTASIATGTQRILPRAELN